MRNKVWKINLELCFPPKDVIIKQHLKKNLGPNCLEHSLTMDRWTLIAVLFCGFISYSYGQTSKKTSLFFKSNLAYPIIFIFFSKMGSNES